MTERTAPIPISEMDAAQKRAADDALVHDFVVELLRTSLVSDAPYEAARGPIRR